ncbi:hypothetical protein HAX54_021797 [Datura stramonium]|uniref:Uncharacterized protein n=1 Tax=Datura stramonium TaxID=4076 RepID=A0ABS8UUF5_DATST|nr:hypothetical protein [Datura stramonium]
MLRLNKKFVQPRRRRRAKALQSPKPTPNPQVTNRFVQIWRAKESVSLPRKDDAQPIPTNEPLKTSTVTKEVLSQLSYPTKEAESNSFSPIQSMPDISQSGLTSPGEAQLLIVQH